MRKAVPAVLILLTGCTSATVDLEVSTSVIEIPTTTTTTEPEPATTSTQGTTTTTGPGLDPVVPDTASTVAIRPVLLAEDDGTGVAEVDHQQIIEWVSEANRIFEPAHIGFSYDPNEEQAVVRDTLLNGIGDGDAAGFVERVLRGNSIAAGYPGEVVVFFRSGPRPVEVGSHHLDFVMMGEWDDTTLCGAPDPTALGHQIGLYLAVPHTFASSHSSAADAADTLAAALQDRAVFDGDGLADTLPDPGVHAEHQCGTEDTVRIGGLDIELPRENIMSHYGQRTGLTLRQAERARWAFALRHANAMAMPSNTGLADAVEAEDSLVATSGPCGLASREALDRFVGYQWGGADHLLVPSDAGCVIEFEVDVPESGRYEVIALATRAPDFGAVEFVVNGERFRFEDLYAPVVIASGPLSLGETTLEAGAVVVGVDVVGSNAQSSGTFIGIDGFSLRRVGG